MPLAPPRDPARVVCVLYDGLCPFEFGIVHEVFGLERPEFDTWYRFSVCAAEKGPLRSAAGLSFDATGSLARLDRAGTILLPGWRGIDAPPPMALLTKLRRAHAAGARILSVCSGVFVLAAAGLLDGKRATTHWRYARALAERYPTIDVDPDVLYVDEGSLLTSAGSAAGIDLCLHLVRRDHGAEVANRVARRLVVPPHRDGGQAQFIDAPVREESRDDLAQLCDWLREHLAQPHSVESIARRMHTSPRTLARRFQESAGTSPHAWLTRERVRHAERLLEGTDSGMEAVAQACGFGSAQVLRQHFRRILGTTPSAFRRRFRREGA